MKSAIHDLIMKAVHENQLFFPQVNSDAYADKLLNKATIFHEELDRKAIAFIAFYDNDESKQTAFLSLVYISPEARRRGIGAKLIEKAIHHLKAKKINVFRLEVHRENLAAIQLYQSVGFKETSCKEQMMEMEYNLLNREKS